MFYEISANELQDNFFEAIGKEDFLISAGNEQGYNMMTAGWGFVGTMWGNDAVCVVIRPQRYTMEFINNNDTFAMTFFGKNRKVHEICGSKSGRNCNKATLAGITPVFSDNTVYFDEARLAIICEKQYVQQMKPDCFNDKESLNKWYPQNDFHYMIIGKIKKVLVNK